MARLFHYRKYCPSVATNKIHPDPRALVLGGQVPHSQLALARKEESNTDCIFPTLDFF